MALIGDISSAIVGLVELFRIFSHENPLRSMVMFHNAVFEHYSEIIKEINNEFEGFVLSKGWSRRSLRAFLPLWFIVALSISFSIYIIAWITGWDICPENIAICGILASSVITPMLSIKKVPGRLGISFVNVSIPVSILSLLFMMGKKMEQGNSIIYLLFVFFLETLWLLGVSRGSLIIKGRELDILSNNDNIKRSTFGLLFTFVISGAIAFIWMLIYSNTHKKDPWINLANLAVVLIWIIILSYVISDVKETAVRLLWKAKVRDFANNLPHLIVKTKTGNIYYGQLYDPLDRKVLVLRKSKLMHNGQIIEGSSLVTKMSEEGDYWNVLWKDIESIKIVEKGLYKSVSPIGSNRDHSLLLSLKEKIEGYMGIAIDSLRCLRKNKMFGIAVVVVSIILWIILWYAWDTLKLLSKKIFAYIPRWINSAYNLTVKTTNSTIYHVGQLQKETLGIISFIGLVSFIFVAFIVGILAGYLLREFKKC